MRDVSRSKVGISHLSKMISCLEISPPQIQIGDDRWHLLQRWNFPSHFQSLCHNILLDKNEMEMSLSFICLGDDNPLSLYSHHVLCTKSQHTICTHNLQFLCRNLLLKKDEMEMSLSFICLDDDNPLLSSLSTVAMRRCAQNPNTPSAHTIWNPCATISYFKRMRWRWVSPLFVLVMTILQSPWVVHKILKLHLHTQPAICVSQILTWKKGDRDEPIPFLSWW